VRGGLACAGLHEAGLPLAPGMEINYVIRDSLKWEVDPERTASKLDAVYYRVHVVESVVGSSILFHR
jgi:hypothetical protein